MEDKPMDAINKRASTELGSSAEMSDIDVSAVFGPTQTGSSSEIGDLDETLDPGIFKKPEDPLADHRDTEPDQMLLEEGQKREQQQDSNLPEEAVLYDPNQIVKVKLHRANYQNIRRLYRQLMRFGTPESFTAYFKHHMKELILILKYLYIKHRLLHLDIKPDNFIVFAGKELWPVLIKFDKETGLQDSVKKGDLSKEMTLMFASYDICQRLADGEVINEAQPNEDLVQLAYTLLYLISDHHLFLQQMSPEHFQSGSRLERLQYVADVKLDIEAEPNERKLKLRLREMFDISMAFDECLDAVVRYLVQLALPFPESDHELLAYFNKLTTCV